MVWEYLRRNNRLTLLWVPRQRGIEKVDILAKKGAETSSTGSRTFP